MKKRDGLILTAMALGIGSGWMVLNESVFAEEGNFETIPFAEEVQSDVTEETVSIAEDVDLKEEGASKEELPNESTRETSENDLEPPQKEEGKEIESPEEIETIEAGAIAREYEPDAQKLTEAAYREISYQTEENKNLNGIVIKTGENVNLSNLVNQYDFFVIQADAGYGQVNTNFSVLADQVLRGEKKLMMYHDGRTGKNVEDGNMEAYGFYNVIKNYIGKGLPVLRFMNDANTGPNWAQTFMDTLYGLSGVRGIVWTNQEKINDGDWSQYDAANYPYTTDVTKYEASDVQWNEQIKVNHASEAEELYRLYNPNSGEHFYTKRSTERDDLVRVGWRYESLGWTTPTEGMGAQVYRLYNPNAGDHHYTMDAGERDMLIGKGWRYEGVGWYSDKNKATAIYRAYNPNAKAGAHHFTSNKEEKDYLVRLGWRDEKIGFYGIVSTLLPRDLPMESYLKEEYGYNTSGAKLSGVQKVQGNYYYFDNQASKAMKKGSGLTQVGNKSVYVNGNGTLQVGQMNTNGGWKWFDPNSAYMVKSTFIDIPAAYNSGKAKRVYYDGNGNMVYGEYVINGIKYSFDKNDGTLLNPLASLLSQIQNYINGNKYSSDIWNVSLRVLGLNGDLLYNNRKQQSASLMKLFVMGAIYQNYESMCSSFGKSIIDSNLHAMITWSSNDAWVYLVSCLGYGNYSSGINNLRNWCNSKGYNETEMLGVPYGNYTSVRDTMNIISDMANNKLRYSSEMISLLKQQTRTSKIPAGIPAGIVTGNKTGELDNTENDVAIVYAPKGTYILSVMSTSLTSTAHAREMIRTISSMVYQYLQQ